MPLILKNFSNNNSVSGIWKITENEEQLIRCCSLNEYDKELLKKTSSYKRRLEILSTRSLIKKLGLDIFINYNDRKPISSKGEISISHSGDLVCVVWHISRKTTIDIEKVGTRIMRIAERAFSKQELQFAKNDPEILTLLWNCKECIFKISDDQGIEFKSQIKVHEFDKSQNILCELLINNRIMHYELQHSKIMDYTLAWGIF